MSRSSRCTTTIVVQPKRVGLVAAASGLVRLPRQIPKKIAVEHILTGRAILAEQARAMQAESTIAAAMGRSIKVLTPLIEFGKADVVRLADAKGITGTYSCHTGNSEPCGRCIACLEFQFEKEA